jgi:hypothetical protein
MPSEKMKQDVGTNGLPEQVLVEVCDEESKQKGPQPAG